MPKHFPVFLDLTGKAIHIYGAGRIASRRANTLLAFASCLTVHAPQASKCIEKAAAEGRLILRREPYEPGTIEQDAFMVLAATDDPLVNRQICEECRAKGIPVNVCSDRTLCDFHFPGIASRGELVIGINAGGTDHRLARKWTEKIQREVEEDGYDDKAQKASDNGKSQEDGAGNTDG